MRLSLDLKGVPLKHIYFYFFSFCQFLWHCLGGIIEKKYNDRSKDY